MSDVNLEEWMHSSDEERTGIIKNWDTGKGEGRDIASKVASLFSKECIYNIAEVDILDRDGAWFIHAYVVVDDYDNLKDRTNIEFLGFKVAFSSMSDYSG